MKGIGMLGTVDMTIYGIGRLAVKLEACSGDGDLAVALSEFTCTTPQCMQSLSVNCVYMDVLKISLPFIVAVHSNHPVLRRPINCSFSTEGVDCSRQGLLRISWEY
jgi:hypothetical protein